MDVSKDDKRIVNNKSYSLTKQIHINANKLLFVSTDNVDTR